MEKQIKIKRSEDNEIKDPVAERDRNHEKRCHNSSRCWIIRRFLIHVLPKGFHRILHYGLLANGNRAESIARAREMLGQLPRVVEPEEKKAAEPDEPRVAPCPCPRCGARMLVIEVFAKGCEPRWRPAPASPAIRIDTS